jgi:hypothetical protein
MTPTRTQVPTAGQRSASSAAQRLSARSAATSTNAAGSSPKATAPGAQHAQCGRAGHGQYVISEAALDCMRGRTLAGLVIDQLAAHPAKVFPEGA